MWWPTSTAMFDYFADNQLAAISRYASTTTSNPVMATSFGYDDVGRLESIHHLGTALGSTFEEEHAYGYDDANRLTSYANLIDGIMADYGYDDAGQLERADDSLLTDEAYSYDHNGNVI